MLTVRRWMTALAVVAAMTGLTLSLVAAPATAAFPAPAADEPRIPCGAIWKWLPTELKKDLRGVRKLPPAQRLAELADIRKAALAGEYGPAVQRFAEHRAVRWARLPKALRRDLAAAQKLPLEERREALRQIRKDALDGDYGQRVQTIAERLDKRRKLCWKGAK